MTRAELERLAIVAEECAEVIQVVNKIIRFSYESRHPDGGPTNRESLEMELGDLQAAINLMVNEKDICINSISNQCSRKMDILPIFLRHQG